MMPMRHHRLRRMRAGRLLRRLLLLVLVLWLFSSLFRDVPLLAFPAAMFGAMIGLPFVILALLIAAMSLLIPLVVLTAVFGLPMMVLYRVVFGDRREARSEADRGEQTSRRIDSTAPAMSEEMQLRRRYVAGELTDNEFQVSMLDVLKERFTRGKMSVSEYEREVDHLLRRSREAQALEERREPLA
jgi:uncharacterized membrane protein